MKNMTNQQNYFSNNNIDLLIHFYFISIFGVYGININFSAYKILTFKLLHKLIKQVTA